jgi:RNA polymerase sigma-70 factor (ECF subfamily)
MCVAAFGGGAAAWEPVFHPQVDDGPDYDASHTTRMPSDTAGGDQGGSRPSIESTIELLARAKAGESTALEALFARCMPPLRRWARGRLPQYARELGDTQDLVQETVLRTLSHLGAFEARHAGALQAYMREAVANRIRDEIRRVARRPTPVELSESQVDLTPSPLEHAIGREGIERYEQALARLRPADREAIVARMELQQSYEEVAAVLDKPSADAARVAVTRALARLVEELDHER